MISGPGRTLTYDPENRLLSVNAVAYLYGPDGERLKKTHLGQTTLYLGMEAELAGGLWVNYLPGDARRSNGQTAWLHRDHLNSVRAITDLTGSIVNRSQYRPYGEQIQTIAGIQESKGFIGERQDPETGLVYLHARFYDPVLGRFLQADTLDPDIAGVDVNRYAYALNDPINKSDPNGHLAQAVVGAVVGGIFGAIVDIAAQMASGTDFSDIDWGSVAVSGAIGVVAGATGVGAAGLVSRAGAAFGFSAVETTVAAEVVGQTVQGVTSDVMNQLADNEMQLSEVDWERAALAGLASGVLGAGKASITVGPSTRAGITTAIAGTATAPMGITVEFAFEMNARAAQNRLEWEKKQQELRQEDWDERGQYQWADPEHNGTNEHPHDSRTTTSTKTGRNGKAASFGAGEVAPGSF
jgi:RHS repeat-associated protein